MQSRLEPIFLLHRRIDNHRHLCQNDIQLYKSTTENLLAVLEQVLL